MSEVAEFFKAFEELEGLARCLGLLDEAKQERASNRDRAWNDFQEASRLASKHGMVLKRHSDTHYQLRHPRARWILDIYPGNQRLYRPNREPRAPFLNVADKCPWTLNDVVQAAVETQS